MPESTLEKSPASELQPSVSKLAEAEKQSVEAVTGRAKYAGLVHAFSLGLAACMFGYLVYELQPLFATLSNKGNWGAFAFLCIACIVIPSYWPGVTYRMMLLSIFPFSSRLGKRTFRNLATQDLPAVSIIVATRNEPAFIVIPLLRSLVNLNYPDFEVVVTDNSDQICKQGKTNQDLVEIAKFSEENGIRFERRSHGRKPDPRDDLPLALAIGGISGDVRGNKAANLNAALQTADDKFQWFCILDADSTLSDETLRQMLAVGCRGNKHGKPVGFVQSSLASSNPKESLLSNAQSVIDDIYYKYYFPVKAAVGVVSNMGHGILVSRAAWRETGGVPLELSEDLAWANELLLHGSFQNYYALCSTTETKPASWRALKIQRFRWAKGTTIQLRKQLPRLWKSPHLRWYEKMDLTYDMTSYLFNAAGCLLPILFICSGVLGSENRYFFQTLVPAFYVAMAMDNLLVPIEAFRLTCKGNIQKAFEMIKAIPFISIYLGAIASHVFWAVGSGICSKAASFSVTPKGTYNNRHGLLHILSRNKFCYLLCCVNGWITFKAWQANAAIAPLLALSPIAYFLAPLIGRKRKRP